MSGQLTEGFRELIELEWTEFVEREADPDASNFDTIITALVRAASKGNLRAIQTALDRLDGKIAMELDVEYPKFYTIYPNARIAADDPKIIEGDSPNVVRIESGVMTVPKSDGKTSIADDDLPTGSIRAVLERMLHVPRTTPAQIVEAARLIDVGEATTFNPLVKNVIVAGLMKLVHDGKMQAVFEVLEQIDGKVADKVKVLGQDVYMQRFDGIAPAGAVKNADGIYQIEADNVTNTWALRLEKEQKKRGR